MVDLGQYAVPVLSAYGGTIVLLVGLVGASVWQARRVARRLDAIEARRGGSGGGRTGGKTGDRAARAK